MNYMNPKVLNIFRNKLYTENVLPKLSVIHKVLDLSTISTPLNNKTNKLYLYNYIL